MPACAAVPAVMAPAPDRPETTGVMSILTEHDRGAGEYEEIGITPGPAAGAGWTMLRRRSALPSRRAVLHVSGRSGLSVPDDIARWYTGRGFHFYAAGQRPRAAGRPRGRDGGRPQARLGGRGRTRARFALLDAACAQLRETEGISSVLISAQSADALAVARWCDARRDAGPADALILSEPRFGRRLRRGLHIACPVLVLSQAARPRAGNAGPALGPHVTWLWLAGPDRKLIFDEMGRWLGAYMYGQVRDQLL
jgi:hypothetical protein